MAQCKVIAAAYPYSTCLLVVFGCFELRQTHIFLHSIWAEQQRSFDFFSSLLDMPPTHNTPSKASTSFQHITRAKKASRKRGPRGPRKGKAAKKPKVVLSDWTCRRCQLTNRASAITCFKCTASREESEVIPVKSLAPPANAASKDQEGGKRKLILPPSSAAGKRAAAAQQQRKPCPECVVGFVVVRRGTYGPFAACTKYPKCTYKGKVEHQDSPAQAPTQQSPLQPSSLAVDKFAITCKYCNSDLVEHGIGCVPIVDYNISIPLIRLARPLVQERPSISMSCLSRLPLFDTL